MNILWCLMLIFSLMILSIKDLGIIVSALTNGSEKAISISIKLWAIYSLWLGLLKIIEETKLGEKFSKFLSPLINFLFGKIDSETKNQISLNITSNLLGLGNASLPSGISAMEKLSKNETYLTTAMLMLLILNSCNLQIIPSTIISLRSLHGSLNPTDIILPNLLTSFISLFIGILIIKSYSKLKQLHSTKNKSKKS